MPDFRRVAVDMLGMGISPTTAPARRGRRCEVCALPTELRTRIETFLVQGRTIARISREDGAPSRDSIRRHVIGGHLPAAIADTVAKTHGLDHAAVAARVVDVAARARQVALEAVEAGDRNAVLRAGDGELRALSVLSHMGVTSETDLFLENGVRDIARAVFALAHEQPALAEAVALRLDAVGRADLAEDLLSQIPENNREVSR